jgi:hypothetical protein
MFTWSDVEKALIQWMKDNEIAKQIDELHQLDVEHKERTMLTALQQKYPSKGTSLQVEEVTHVPVQFPAARIASCQLSLFQEDGC